MSYPVSVSNDSGVWPSWLLENQNCQIPLECSKITESESIDTYQTVQAGESLHIPPKRSVESLIVYGSLLFLGVVAMAALGALTLSRGLLIGLDQEGIYQSPQA